MASRGFDRGRAGWPRVASRRRARRGRGYTILEFTLVLGILGILTAIAIAAYQDYTKRTRMIEVMLAAGTCRTPVFEAYYYGAAPAPGNWGCESAVGVGDYVQSIAVDPNGKVTVTARGFGDDDIDGRVLTLQPLIEGVVAAIATGKGKQIEWRCGDPEDGTSIHSDYLPVSCRGNP